VESTRDTITVKDRQDVFEISFSDIKKYHGLGNIAGAAFAFKALQAAFAQLLGQAPAPREDTSVQTGHSGSGVRDAIEMVTRAATRGVYSVDTNLPKARLNPYRQLSFTFIVTVATQRAEVALKPGVLPARFFELMNVNTDEARAELDQLKRQLAEKIIASANEELFEITVLA
jgi:hypothetical protein